jgi:hypothetical protein
MHYIYFKGYLECFNAQLQNDAFIRSQIDVFVILRIMCDCAANLLQNLMLLIINNVYSIFTGINEFAIILIQSC